MSAEEHNLLGKITVSPIAVATVASQAALQSYGVVGMAAKNVVDGLTNIITRDPRHGVDVVFHEGGVVINIYVIIEYGTRISTVASSLSNAVQFNVERALGLDVKEVNVHVQGLRISTPDARE
jgi:uncharacterized alkaline shock family protein YloU